MVMVVVRDRSGMEVTADKAGVIVVRDPGRGGVGNGLYDFDLW